MSTPPKRASVALTKASTSAPFVTSAVIARMSPPVARRTCSTPRSSTSLRRAHAATFAPERANRSTHARPSPSLPPVTIATLPARPSSSTSMSASRSEIARTYHSGSGRHSPSPEATEAGFSARPNDAKALGPGDRNAAWRRAPSGGEAREHPDQLLVAVRDVVGHEYSDQAAGDRDGREPASRRGRVGGGDDLRNRREHRDPREGTELIAGVERGVQTLGQQHRGGGRADRGQYPQEDETESIRRRRPGGHGGIQDPELGAAGELRGLLLPPGDRLAPPLRGAELPGQESVTDPQGAGELPLGGLDLHLQPDDVRVLATVNLLHLRQLLPESGQAGALAKLQVLLDVEGRQRVRDARYDLGIPPTDAHAEGDCRVDRARLYPFELHLDVGPKPLDRRRAPAGRSELWIEIEAVHEGPEASLAQDLLGDRVQAGLEVAGDREPPGALDASCLRDEERRRRAVHPGEGQRET